MVRFVVSSEIEVPKGENSTLVMYEMLDLLTQPVTWERHLGLRDVVDEGHVTENPESPTHRYLFKAVQPSLKVNPLRRGSAGPTVYMSYTQDPDNLELKFHVESQATRYFTRTIRVVEHETPQGTSVLEVKCDVVIDFKYSLLSTLSKRTASIRAEHQRLLEGVLRDVTKARQRRSVKTM